MTTCLVHGVGVFSRVQVVLRAKHFDRVGLVQIEVLGACVQCYEASTAPEPWDPRAFGHVFAVVPLVKFIFRFWQQVMPDCDDARSSKAHISSV